LDGTRKSSTEADRQRRFRFELDRDEPDCRDGDRGP